jgi:hypothetical protein
MSSTIIQTIFRTQSVASKSAVDHRIRDGLSKIPSGGIPSGGSTSFCSLRERLILIVDNFRPSPLRHKILTTVTIEMESKEEIWSEKYTLDLPPDISRDKSELDYLRRTIMEAAAEAVASPQLKPSPVRKGQPIIIFRPTLTPASAEIVVPSLMARETARNKGHEIDSCSISIKHLTEDTRRDSGVAMEDEDENENPTIPNQATKSVDLTEEARRDSGIAIEDEDKMSEPLNSSLKSRSCKNLLAQGTMSRDRRSLAFQSEADAMFKIDEAFTNFVIREHPAGYVLDETPSIPPA